MITKTASATMVKLPISDTIAGQAENSTATAHKKSKSVAIKDMG
jgi:hypothetical protein